MNDLVSPEVYPDSVVEQGGATFALERDRTLIILAEAENEVLASFTGDTSPEGKGVLKRCPLTPENAAALRRALPWLEPVPLGLETSAGFGDRLGNATPGHVRALRGVGGGAGGGVGGGVAPIFAQQSIREMTRTGRTPQEVMDDATWGTFQAGWRDKVGADADHLKTPEDVDACAAAGFTFFTIDPGDLVDDEAESAAPEAVNRKVEALPLATLETTRDDFLKRYAGKTFDLGETRLELSEEAALRALAKYGPSLAHTLRLYRHLAGKGVPFDLEVSVDETNYPTKPAEHVIIASELKRLGVGFVSLAPRYVGSFEKGIDFIGDLDDLAASLRVHADIARTLGPYKLSLHSGSDKFSVYGLIAEATGGLVHLKTAGTSYLEALRVVSRKVPSLFKDILELAHERFEKDKKSYHLSCDPAKVPHAADLKDDDLPDLLEQTDARQVLHVTFGSALDRYKPDIMAVLEEHEEAYYDGLAAHFERHLKPFVEARSA